MITIKLVPPTEKCRESFVRGLREFRNEGLPWWIGGDLEAVQQDFAAFVATKLADAHRRTETFVPATHLWALAEETFAGRISIRHELNDALRAAGGHIGYDVVPSLRGRGVATEMLRQALPVARRLGLTEVLITCDDTNAASIRVIEKNGGILRETRALETRSKRSIDPRSSRSPVTATSAATGRKAKCTSTTTSSSTTGSTGRPAPSSARGSRSERPRRRWKFSSADSASHHTSAATDGRARSLRARRTSRSATPTTASGRRSACSPGPRRSVLPSA